MMRELVLLSNMTNALRAAQIQISLQQTARMAIEAASGIYHLHCEGVIHRVRLFVLGPINKTNF